MAEYLDINERIVGEDGKPTKYLEDYLYGIIQGLGGEGAPGLGGIAVEVSQVQRLTYISGQVNQLADKIAALEAEKVSSTADHKIAQLQIDVEGFEQKSIPFDENPSSYEAYTKEWLNVKRGAIVDLMANPTDNAVIVYRSGDNTSKNINGNGRNINGQETQTATREGTILVFYYFRPSDEWFMTISIVEDLDYRAQIKDLAEQQSHLLAALLVAISEGQNLDAKDLLQNSGKEIL